MRGRSKLDSKMGRSKLSLNPGRLAGGACAPSARHRLGSFVRQRLATSGARNGQTSFLESPANTMGVLSYYQLFEGLVALILTLVIALIILVALFRLTSSVITGLLFGALDPLDPGIFQSVFGEILTLLIALEFNHTLQYVVKRQQSIIQTQVVLLIALLAIARKVIVLDLGSVDAAQLLGLAAITLGLGIAYWLIRERDDRIDTASNTQAE